MQKNILSNMGWVNTYRPDFPMGGESFVPGESEVAVIAGMGGGLMQKILGGSPGFLRKNSCVVLQPQSEIEAVSPFLTEDGWCILEEDMVLEDRKILSDDVCDKKETAMPLDNPYRNAKDIDFYTVHIY